jgi:hypothetical protein
MLTEERSQTGSVRKEYLMPLHQGLWFQQWGKCGICFFTFPLGELMMQKGILRDAKCMDNLDVEYRPKIIAETLSDTQEVENELMHIADDPQVIEF